MQQTWPFPARDLVLENDHVRITPVELEHDLQNLFVAASIEHNRDDIFTYHVNVPPMKDLETFRRYLTKKLATHSEVTYKVFSKRLQCLAGCASLMSVRTEHGTIEVGSIWYSKAAQRTEINSNAMLLLFEYVFESLGYRRLEWKCNNANEPSRQAALRLGFVYEGLFRQHFVSRGANRDTAWFSIIDGEWQETKARLLGKMGRHNV